MGRGRDVWLGETDAHSHADPNADAHPDTHADSECHTDADPDSNTVAVSFTVSFTVPVALTDVIAVSTRHVVRRSVPERRRAARAQRDVAGGSDQPAGHRL